MDFQPTDFESEVADLLQQNCPVAFSPVMPKRKTRVVSLSSARRIMLGTPLKSPVRIRLQSSPGGAVNTSDAIDSQPFSQVLSSFTCGPGPESVSQGAGWSLRREKGNARKGMTQFKRPGRIPAPIPEATEVAAVGDEGSADDDEALPVAAPKPGRFPPPSIHEQRLWKSVAFGAGSASSRISLDLSKLPVVDIPSVGGSAGRPYVLRSLFRDSGCQTAGKPASGVKSSSSFVKIIGVETDVLSPTDAVGARTCDEDFLCVFLLKEYVDDVPGLDRVSIRLPHNGKIVDTFSSCCDYSAKFSECPNHSGQEPLVANVKEQVVSAEAEVLHEGTILNTTFQSESETDWFSEEDGTQLPLTAGNDSEEESDWEDYQDEILEEDLPRLGLTKVDSEFLSDPWEWQLADENWPSSNTSFSHNCAFEGEAEEPLPNHPAAMNAGIYKGPHDVRVATWNLDGLKSPPRKYWLRTYLRQVQPHLLAVQELHVSLPTLRFIRRMAAPDYQGYYSLAVDRKGGVALYVHSQCTVKESFQDPQGRFVWVLFSFDGLDCGCVAVYSPHSAADRRQLWLDLRQNLPHRRWIFLGDLNSTELPADSSGQSQLLKGAE
ncbi:hypothetical protein R1sor_001726 [Riccia sorocarpa]|uniref:Endonuclease/exonuclease/phosphatase domain-containing protein n=1 Tax=Riccia sorocarpa TaxID=122646 RepID=A0ABD3H2P1_9MARC